MAGLRKAVWVAQEMEVILEAGEMEVVLLAREMDATWVAEEIDLVAGLDILAGAGTKHNDGKTTKVMRGGILHCKSIRAMMTDGEGDAGPGDDRAGLGDGGAEVSRSRWLVAFHLRRLFIISSSRHDYCASTGYTILSLQK